MLVTQIFKQKAAHRIVTVRPDLSVSEAVTLLKEQHIGALMVTGDDGALTGILSERDVVRAMPEHGAALFDLPISRLMTSPVVTCAPDDRVHQIMKKMTDGHFRHMPVIGDGKLVGMISIGDVVKSRLDELETETSQLRDYIASG